MSPRHLQAVVKARKVKRKRNHESEMEVSDALDQSSTAIASTSAIAKMWRHARTKVKRNIFGVVGAFFPAQLTLLLCVVAVFRSHFEGICMVAYGSYSVCHGMFDKTEHAMFPIANSRYGTNLRSLRDEHLPRHGTFSHSQLLLWRLRQPATTVHRHPDSAYCCHSGGCQCRPESSDGRAHHHRGTAPGCACDR